MSNKSPFPTHQTSSLDRSTSDDSHDFDQEAAEDRLLGEEEALTRQNQPSPVTSPRASSGSQLRTADQHSATPFTKQSNNTGLSLQHVSRHFGDTQVLNNLSLDIAAGEVVAIIGKSGCGKSTLLRLLAGLDEANSGTLTWKEEPIRRQTSHIRLMFQEPRLLPWKSVLQNASLGTTEDIGRKTLGEVGLSDRMDRWPSQLSGGQRSRVALARALAHKPELLLLDEPLGALDALTRSSMHVLIERLWREYGFTLILVTHDVAEAVMLADRVILLDAGEVKLDLHINLPRPRSATDTRTLAYEAELLEELTRDPSFS
ncbi:Vitamin B12 import ATP-binding protein BtuD [Halomonadaceae bacterium LMG 33818]|uniref:ABC transporter ATP-binding protein n=1 Tax=Cernens ardua TaxID=3402176 RepID=UPI003EDB7682